MRAAQRPYKGTKGPVKDGEVILSQVRAAKRPLHLTKGPIKNFYGFSYLNDGLQLLCKDVLLGLTRKND